MLSVLNNKLKEELKAEMKTIRVTLERDIGTETREIRVDLRKLKTEMDFIKKVFGEIKAYIETVIRENVHLKHNKQRFQLRSESLYIDMKKSMARIDNREQHCTNANLEVKGIVGSDDENVIALQSKIGESIGEPIA